MNDGRPAGAGRRAIPAVKNALIVLLTLSAVFMVWRISLFGDIYDSFNVVGGALGESGENGGPAGAGETAPDARRGETPACIVITNSLGEHFGVKYDAATLALAYGRTGSVFGEAFGSASRLKPTGEEEWRDALRSKGVFYSYQTGVGIEALGSMFGARIPSGNAAGDISVRRLCIVFGEERDRLILQDGETGEFYGADTASLGEEAQVVGLFGSNGARFAFETGEYGAADPYFILLPDEPHPVLTAANPMEDEEEMAGVLIALGVSNQLKSSYTDPDGTRVYVAGSFTFSIDPDGRAAYRADPSAMQPIPGTRPGEGGGAAAIAAARRAAENTVGRTMGDALLRFDGAELMSDGSYNVKFTYSPAGGRVFLGGGDAAAEITIRDGAASAMTLVFRRYAVTDEYVKLMPERQALAASDGELWLGYFDAGGNGAKLAPEWVYVNGGDTR
jgi:hypothetical protein